MAVMRNEFTEAMKQDMYDYFLEAYPQKPPEYASIFEIVPSSASYEKFTSAVGLGELLEKPEHEDMKADKPMESYSIICKNRTFARVVPFSYETVEDTQKLQPIVQKTVATWAPQVIRAKEKFYASLYNYGAITAGNDVYNNTITGVIDDSTTTSIYDGKVWFDTDHPDRVGNTYSNFNSSYSLTSANLKTVYSQFTDTLNKDERGQIMEHTPDALIHPPALKFTAQEILESTLVPGVTNNTKNVLQSILPPLSWSYLTDADGWFVSKLKMGKMATDRKTPVLDFWKDELNLGHYASIVVRFGGAITNFRFDIGCNLDTT